LCGILLIQDEDANLTGKNAMRRLIGTRRWARMTTVAAIATGVTGAVLAVATQGAGQSTTLPDALVATVTQASWTPITTLTAPNWEGDSEVISVDNYGDFLTGWSGISNTDPSCNPQTQIRIRYRTGKLGSVEQLTPCGHPWTSFPVVASNASGYGIAAWIYNPSTDAIQARTISPTGKLGPLLTVTPKGYQADLVNVAMSPTGQALVVWHEVSTVLKSPNSILARFISPGSTLGPVLDIGGATGQLPSVVFDKTGTATVGWSAGGDQSVARRVTPKGMGAVKTIFGPPYGKVSGTVYGTPRLADDSNGDTFVLATADTTVKNKGVEHLLYRKWAKSGTLGPVITVANPRSTLSITNIGDGPALAADGKGDAVVTWDSALTTVTVNHQPEAAVWGRRVSSSGKLGPSVHLGSGFLPKVAVDPAGAGLVTWQSGQVASPYPTNIHGRRVSATTGTFGAQLEFTGAGAYANIAVDPAGEFGVIWERFGIQARFGR
jgi:hypothetical protein